MCAIDRETRLTLCARWKLKEGRRHLACAFVGDKLKGENRFIDRKLPTKYCMSTCPLMTLSSGSHTHYVSVPIFRFPFLSKTYRDRTRRQTTNYSGLTSEADKIKVQGSRRRVKAHRRSALFARAANMKRFCLANALFYPLDGKIFSPIKEKHKSGSVDARCLRMFPSHSLFIVFAPKAAFVQTGETSIRSL